MDGGGQSDQPDDDEAPGHATPAPNTTTTLNPGGRGAAGAATEPDSSPSGSAASPHPVPALLDRLLSRVRLLGRARPATTATHSAGLPPRRRTQGVQRAQPECVPDDATAVEPGPDKAAPAPARPELEVVVIASPETREPAFVSASTSATDTVEASESDSVFSTASSGCMIFEPPDNGIKRFKAKDLGPFCEQLDRLLDYIHSTSDLNNLIYNYPSKLQNSLDAKAKELCFMYSEARAARIRIQQVKNQRKAVRKECKVIERTLNLLQEEEIKEMENYINLYDKTLGSRWEKIHHSSQEDVVESFIHDIKGKQKALDYLCTLATNKLNKLHKTKTQPPTSVETKPVSLALRRLPVSGAARSAARWRNRHHDRTPRGPLNTAQAMDANAMIPVVPLATAPFSLMLGPAFSVTSNSNDLSRTSTPLNFESASGSLIPSNELPILNISAINDITRPTTPNTPDRRSILQALFTDMQHAGTHDNLPINAVMPVMPHFVATSTARVSGSAGAQQTTNSPTTSNAHDIELESVHDLSQ